MIETELTTSNDNGADDTLRSKTESRFRLIIVASLRAKQLQRGAHPRIEADAQRRRNTSIALEEVRQGLVPFTLTHKVPEKKADNT